MILQSRPGEKRRILVIDNDSDICTVFQMVLQDEGYDYNSYTDSVKALQEFKAGYYDLILLDLKMPGLSGFDLCKKIREFDKIVKIFFVTGSSSQAFFEKITQDQDPLLKDIDYIQKPIANHELVSVIRNAFSK
jgi:DNA-binding response OmpR family regulator